MRKMNPRIYSHVARLLVYAIIIVLGVVLMLPFAWMLSTALKRGVDIYRVPIQWIPNPPQWFNFVKALTVMPFDRYFLNSGILCATSIIGTILSCSVVAFGFSWLRFRGKELLFLIVLSTMMLPSQVTMIPRFVLFKNLGWVDTFAPLIVPSWFAVNGFHIFLLRQFFLSIPGELVEAAKIDGCSSLTIYGKIVMPLARPALIAVGIFTFMNVWNDFMGPLIYISSENNWTVSLALSAFRGGEGSEPQLHLMMAAASVAILPCIAIFFVAQKYFIQGIVFTGIK